MPNPRAHAMTRLRRQRLLAGPVGRVLFSLSWPLSLGLFSVIAFNIVDTLYIGRLGPDHLAAIGYCFPVIFCMSAVSIGMGNGATSVVSRSLGRGDMDRARLRMTDTAIFATLIALVLLVIMKALIDPVFGLLGTPQDLMPFVHEYMDIWFSGLPLLILPIVFNGLIRATGDAIFPSGMMVMAAIINALISPFLVFGLMGAPELGMAGAAWATLIARGTLTIASFLYLYRQGLVSFTRYDFHTFPSSVSEILRFGFPAFLAQLVVPLSAAIAVRLLSLSGPQAVAAFTVATRAESLMTVPLFSIGSGVTPFTGQNVGAGRPERLQRAEWRALGFSLFWGLIGGAIMIGFGRDIAGLFSEDERIVALADRFLALIGTGLWGAGFLQVAIGTLNPLGHPLVGMALSILRHLVLYAGGAILLVLVFGFDPTDVVLVVGPLAYMVVGLAAAIVTLWLVRRVPPATDRTASAPTAPPAA